MELAPIGSSGVRIALKRANEILEARSQPEPRERCGGCGLWVLWSDINPSLWALCRECENDMIDAAPA